MKRAKHYLKKAGFKNTDDAENENHHSIVALEYAEERLNHDDSMVRNYSEMLFQVSKDLCENDYDKQKFSQTSRQVLIHERDTLMSKIGYRLRNLTKVPF
jgi:hypothetical protein